MDISLVFITKPRYSSSWVEVVTLLVVLIMNPNANRSHSAVARSCCRAKAFGAAITNRRGIELYECLADIEIASLVLLPS